MNKLFLLFLLVFNNISFSQGIEGEMQVSTQNKGLILELMRETKFEDYFKDYCSKRIDFLGEEKKIEKEKIIAYKKKINFSEFLDFTIYNQFAMYSSEELKQMISLFKSLNKNKNFNFIFLSTPGIESNLELQIRQYMKD